ncbi:PREDICTED: defensin-like protein 21 [Camelina sativa]|uniref:Defensin-like protein 21 n=1 Tax=Camelina sativa TaxID=90675 RepID=A0ABM0U398_CAMSA|nr:PREDICTED: defensin-like protein 21 [Camelina sativa]
MLRLMIIYLVLFATIVLCMGSNKIDGETNIAPWVYEIKSRCCKEHRSLERCLPGIDDNPDKNGKCWIYCVQECKRGGFCKRFGKKHICHCCCSVS